MKQSHSSFGGKEFVYGVLVIIFATLGLAKLADHLDHNTSRKVIACGGPNDPIPCKNQGVYKKRTTRLV